MSTIKTSAVTLIDVAQREEEVRRLSSHKEFEQLFNITKNAIEAYSGENLREEVLRKLSQDRELIKKTTDEWKALTGANFPFKTNKNAEIIDCAYSIVEEHSIITDWSYLQSHFPMKVETRTFLGGRDGDLKGTSCLNCLQVSLFSTLSLIEGAANIQKITALSSANIYDVKTSPLVQTTKLPVGVENTKSYDEFKSSSYFYQDSLSPKQGEMLFFTLGYSFGGSRADTRYKDKELRAEDCSSAIAKWVHATVPFATTHMKNAYKGNCQQDTYCNAAAETLDPIKGNFSVVKEGDIYAFEHGGHTGVVVDKINDTCFVSLSYSRDVPNVEGFGYGTDCIDNRSYLFFKPIMGEENSYSEDEL